MTSVVADKAKFVAWNVIQDAYGVAAAESSLTARYDASKWNGFFPIVYDGSSLRKDGAQLRLFAGANKVIYVSSGPRDDTKNPYLDEKHRYHLMSLKPLYLISRAPRDGEQVQSFLYGLPGPDFDAYNSTVVQKLLANIDYEDQLLPSAWKYQELKSGEVVRLTGPFLSLLRAIQEAIGSTTISAAASLSLTNNFDGAKTSATACFESLANADEKERDRLVPSRVVLLDGEAFIGQEVNATVYNPGPFGYNNKANENFTKPLPKNLKGVYSGPGTVYILYVRNAFLVMKVMLDRKGAQIQTEQMRLQKVLNRVNAQVSDSEESGQVREVLSGDDVASGQVQQWANHLRQKYDGEYPHILDWPFRAGVDEKTIPDWWNRYKAEFESCARRLRSAIVQQLRQALTALSERVRDSQVLRADDPVCWCGCPKRICLGKKSGRIGDGWDNIDGVVTAYKDLYRQLGTVGDFPVFGVEREGTTSEVGGTLENIVLEAYNSHSILSEPHKRLFKKVGRACPGLSDETCKGIAMLVDQVDARIEVERRRLEETEARGNEQADGVLPQAEDGNSALLWEKLEDIKVDGEFQWDNSDQHTLARLLIKQYLGDTALNDVDELRGNDTCTQAFELLPSKVKALQGIRIRSQQPAVPSNGRLSTVLNALNRELVEFPGSEPKRIFAGFAHDEGQWPRRAAHKTPDRLVAIQKGLDFLADHAEALSYTESQTAELRRLAQSVLVDKSSEVPAQGSARFQQFLSQYAPCVQQEYMSRCRGETAAEDEDYAPCVYRGPDDADMTVNLAQFVFYHLQMIMLKALVMMRPGLGKTLALINCLLERYFRHRGSNPGAAYGAQRHIVVVPNKKLLADLRTVLEQQLAKRNETMEVCQLGYTVIGRPQDNTNRLNSIRDTIPRALNASGGRGGGGAAVRSSTTTPKPPVLLLSLADLRMLLTLNTLQDFKNISLDSFAEIDPVDNTRTTLRSSGVCVYFDEIHDVYAERAEALARLEAQCSGQHEAKGPKFQDGSLEKIRRFLGDASELVGFSGTPYRFENGTGQQISAGDSKDSASGIREIDRYNDMFRLPGVGHYLLVGLYTPTGDMAVMRLNMKDVKFGDIRLSGKHFLNPTKHKKLVDAKVSDTKLHEAYVVTVGYDVPAEKAAVLKFQNGSEYLLEWLQTSLPYETDFLHKTIFWAQSDVNKRRGLDFGQAFPHTELLKTQENGSELKRTERPTYHQYVWEKLKLGALDASSSPSPSPGHKQNGKRTVIMFTENDIGYELMQHCVLARVPFIAISKDETAGTNLVYDGQEGSRPRRVNADIGASAYAIGLKLFNSAKGGRGRLEAKVLFYNTVGLEQGEDIEHVDKLAVLSLADNPLTQLQCLFRVNRFGKVVKHSNGKAPPIEIELFPTPYNRTQFCNMMHLLVYYSEMVRDYTQLAQNMDEMFMAGSTRDVCKRS